MTLSLNQILAFIYYEKWGFLLDEGTESLAFVIFPFSVSHSFFLCYQIHKHIYTFYLVGSSSCWLDLLIGDENS